jgi:hypothetical protein
VQEFSTSFDSLRKKALIVAAVAGVIAIMGAFINPARFFQAYLMAFIFWSAIALGSLVTLMIHHMTGGVWTYLIRRPLEAAAKTIPWVGLMFIPIIIGMPHLYEWSVPANVEADKYLQFKAPYLNTPFFVIRALIYFAIWGGLAHLLTRWSYEQDQTGEALLNKPMRVTSGIGIVLYAIASTFAAFDWIMSLDAHWFSSIYGPMFMVGHGLTALAFMLLVLVSLAKSEPLSTLVNQDRYHDLGKWFFALIILWMYMMLAQFIIIWSGNLPEHIVWYLRRIGPAWKTLAALLVAFHFLAPFLILLSRLTKQKAPVLIKVAFGILFMRFLDLFWLIAPELNEGVFRVHVLDAIVPVALGGVWVYFFAGYLSAQSLVVKHDPRFEHVLNGGEGSHE